MKASSNRCRRGFTIIEVMVALTITLLMMAALAQAFKFLGTQMQSGRAEVELSGQARSLAVRLRDELRRTTAPIAPPQDAKVGQGYFMMLEGPLSDITSAIHGEQPSTANENSYKDSKWGDIDDYLAFTIQAPPGSWFTGKVPQFVTNPAIVDDTSTPFNEVFEPVEINSQYAEVVYWLSPEWERDATLQTAYPGEDPRNLVYGPQGVPVFKDVDANGIPDRMVLRRRLLLIRPDLNFPNGALPVPNGREHSFWFQTDMTTSPRTIQPYLNNNFASGPRASFVSTPIGSAVTAPVYPSCNWLTGMQLAYQLCDLSIGRRLNYVGPAADIGEPITPPNTAWMYPGIAPSASQSPDTGLQANSLADVARPHNRFAHVRIPGEYFNSAWNERTSMPIVALTGTDPLAASGWSLFNNSPVSKFPYPATTWGNVANGNNISMFNGFLLPHFELSSYASTANLINDSRWDRTGEDLVATQVLTFDVQGFDPQAPVFLTNGADGAPGTSGFDDDNNGTVDDFSEQGAAGTDDLLVTPDDPGFYQAIVSGNINPSPGVTGGGTPAINPTLADRGAFVDLGYANQAGGAMRDAWAPTGIARMNNYLETPLSGYNSPIGTGMTQVLTMQSLAMRLSGRWIAGSVFPNATSPQYVIPRLQQVAYDTSTSAYESDGFSQQHIPLSVTPLDPKTDRLRTEATWWMLGGGAIAADAGVNGLDDPNSNPGVDDESEREVSPPFAYDLRGIRVRIRVEDDATNQFKQTSVVHDFVR